MVGLAFGLDLLRRPARLAMLVLATLLCLAAANRTALSQQQLTRAEIEKLVARIALYPDPLLALVLQASLFPLDVVAAQRFLEKHKTDPKLAPSKDWDGSVTGLLNYPTVVAMMNEDLDWTQNLGAAVSNQLADVQAGVQQVRSELNAAGVLKSDDKQVVKVEKDTIRIEPAKPEVIYVPQYDYTPASAYEEAGGTTVISGGATTVVTGASTTVIAGGYPPPPVIAYAPAAPSFWSNAAWFAGGMVIGGLLGYAIGDDDDGCCGWGWGDHDVDIDIDRDINISGNTINRRTRVDAANVQNRLQDRTRTRNHNIDPARAQQARDTLSRQTGGLAKPAASPARPAARGAASGAARSPGNRVRPSGSAASPRQNASRARMDQAAQRHERAGGSSSAFGDLHHGHDVRRESLRGAQSRQQSFAQRAPGRQQTFAQRAPGRQGGSSPFAAHGNGASERRSANRGAETRSAHVQRSGGGGARGDRGGGRGRN